jgi:hypothetical protein
MTRPLNRELRSHDQRWSQSRLERIMWFKVANTVRDLHRTFGEALNSYRPEQHYMRGPGPACRAKRATLAAASSLTPRGNDRTFAAHIAEAQA